MKYLKKMIAMLQDNNYVRMQRHYHPDIRNSGVISKLFDEEGYTEMIRLTKKGYEKINDET